MKIHIFLSEVTKPNLTKPNLTKSEIIGLLNPKGTDLQLFIIFKLDTIRQHHQ